MWNGHMMGWGWSGFGMISMVLWWVVLLLAVVVLARWLLGERRDAAKTGDARAGGDDSLRILRERFARGEIDEADFERRRSILDR